MTFNNLSTLNAQVIVTINGAPIIIDQFDPNSDIFTINDRQTGDGEVTPDGHFCGWAMRGIIETSFNVTATSKGGQALQGILNAQGNGKITNASIIVENEGKTTYYGPGILTTAKPAPHLGNQKAQPITFNFKFGNLVG